jgi:uncharacterized membrane protein (DUF2068 family)
MDRRVYTPCCQRLSLPAHVSTVRSDRVLQLIGAFKLLKGVLLLGVGIGALGLLHKDVSEVAERWVNLLRFDPDNRYIHRMLEKLWSVDDRKLKEISAGTFVYAALFFTEGTGLLLKKRWAEYFAVIFTASFLPLEIYELLKRVSMTRSVVIAINALIVWYLIVNLRSESAEARSGKPGA